ncbi:hypothetical protein EV702DRAFT_710096 [Suillus placidus]|uniref:Uncharacterized protein n=1 Tax=Suillus placidus TaxID=48579 RepID=A0A9P6ZLK6_9AGAM|nr:hypothetical protein EV702DRAFT_710096 [Suillus placidus]
MRWRRSGVRGCQRMAGKLTSKPVKINMRARYIDLVLEQPWMSSFNCLYTTWDCFFCMLAADRIRPTPNLGRRESVLKRVRSLYMAALHCRLLLESLRYELPLTKLLHSIERMTFQDVHIILCSSGIVVATIILRCFLGKTILRFYYNALIHVFRCRFHSQITYRDTSA